MVKKVLTRLKKNNNNNNNRLDGKTEQIIDRRSPRVDKTGPELKLRLDRRSPKLDALME